MSRDRKLPPYSDDDIAADPDLAAALLSDAEALLAIEQQMKALREQKADLFDDMRHSRFKPEFAKAWVATQLVDEEKDAARAEKEIVLARVVSAMDAAKGAKARARAGVRPREEKSAPRQAEKFDAETGEVEPAKGVAQTDTPARTPMQALERLEVVLDATIENADNAAAIAAALRPAPYRITPATPAPEPVDPDVSPLIADAAARMAKAAELLARQEAAE